MEVLIRLILLFSLSFAVFGLNEPLKNVPIFGTRYEVEGVLSLPYAEIKEPFKAWYDRSNGRSRVDYYDGVVKTIQRLDVQKSYGEAYKVAFMVDPKGNPQRVCFLINGTEASPVDNQNVLPDLTSFTFSANQRCPETDESIDHTCEKWENIVTDESKTNRYAFWLKRDEKNNPIPVYYVMEGYDTLFTSHYDKYEISYKNYKLVDYIDANIFNFVRSMKCRGFPGPGMEDVGLNNPIKEFVNGYSKHIDKSFNSFIQKHGKVYKNNAEQRTRHDIFRQNYRFIMSKNRFNINYKMAINNFADLTNNEMQQFRGRLNSGVENNGGLAFHKNNYPKAVPDQWDWRILGAVTPVKDQAVCGSCWSFGTTGTIEGVNFVKTGHLLRLSEQQLMDCSWNEGDNGCDGGEDFRAYSYIIKVGGLSTEDDYGPYLGNDGICHDKSVKKAVKLSGFYNVTSGDADALTIAIFNNGPVTVAIDASHKSLSFYSNGVYFEPQCGNKPADLDHQVLAVGFGTLNGQKYWLIKNSWSTYWGDDGYVLMNQKDNNCGVLTSPTFPKIDN